MKHSDFIEFFKQNGITASINDTGDYAITVTTEYAVPDAVKFALETIRPVGMKIHYALKTRSAPVPSVLVKWYKDTAKAMK